MTDPYQRYLNVQSLINELENGKPTRQYEWFERQNVLLEEYREYFGDFSNVRSSNPEFNKNIKEVFELISVIGIIYMSSLSCKIEPQIAPILSPDTAKLHAQQTMAEYYRFETCCGYTAPFFAFFNAGSIFAW
jgi:hypothetical protein